MSVLKTHNTVGMIGVICVVVGFGALFVLAIKYVGPYAHHRNFIEAQCTVLNATQTRSDVYCDCSDTETWYDSDGTSHTRTLSCESSYPCQLVQVNYKDEDGNFVPIAILFEDSYTLMYHSVLCSYRPTCSKYRRENVKLVKNFAERWGRVGKRFHCYYNPSTRDEVIIWVVTSTVVLHCILWPSVLIAIGIACSVAACVLKGKSRSGR